MDALLQDNSSRKKKRRKKRIPKRYEEEAKLRVVDSVKRRTRELRASNSSLAPVAAKASLEDPGSPVPADVFLCGSPVAADEVSAQVRERASTARKATSTDGRATGRVRARARVKASWASAGRAGRRATVQTSARTTWRSLQPWRSGASRRT